MMPVDIETQVREYTESLVSATSPISLEDIQADAAVDLILDGTPQPVVRSRFSGLGRGLLVAGAVAVVVLVVGLVSVLTGPIDELELTATAPVESAVTVPGRTPPESVPFDSVEWPGLTDDIPEGVESGLLTTPIGAARWVHLTSSEYTLPAVGDLMIDQNGFAISETQFRDWQSDDGIEWRQEESSNDTEVLGFDVGGAESTWIPHVDASYSLVWAINENPLGIWIFDYDASDVVDLSGLVPPESDGFTWDLDISTPLTRYRPETIQSVLHVGFTGPDGQVDQRLLVIEDNQGHEVAYVEVPWDVSSNVTLFGTSEMLFAYVGDPNSNLVSVWRSEDGYRWTESGLLHAELGVPSTLNLQITVLPALFSQSSDNSVRNQMVVVTTADRGWESTNGVDWTPAPEAIPDGTYPIRLESGWFASDGGLWWMHVGDTWVSLAELGMERIGDGCQIIPRAAGQTTLFFGNTCAPDSSEEFPTDLWIISR